MTTQQSAWDRYRTLLAIAVMILGAATRFGTNSWIPTIAGIVIGIVILALPRSS